MAHFAEINTNNFVLRVVVVNNNELLDENGVEQEHLGVAFCKKLFGGNWIQTSYNGSFRKNFAGVGYWYDPGLDAFIPPKPDGNWLLDEATCTWQEVE
jgi:hypothetical protein